MAKRNPFPLVVFNPPRRRNPAPEWPRATLGRAPEGAVIPVDSEGEQLEFIARALLEIGRAMVPSNIDRKYVALMRDTRRILESLQAQVKRGHHVNPGGRKIARHVQAIAYIHAKDGDAYVHGFGNHDPSEADLKRGWLNLAELKTVTNVEAFYHDDGTVTLRHKDGKKLVELFPE